MSSEPPELPFSIPLPAEPPRAAWDRAMVRDPEAPRTVEAGIPMRDGVELAADVHLPAASELPAAAVVIGTPYDKSSSLDAFECYREAGYAVVVYDIRGRGKSEGEWNSHSTDDVDGHDAVEWVAAQDWCTGAVGVVGLSYSGYVVWATMSQRPPHLKAAISISPAGRFMQETPYTNGCFWLYYVYWFAFVRRRIIEKSIDVTPLLDTLPVRAIGKTLDIAGPAWEDFMEHDTLDEYWRAMRWDGEYDFGVPCLHVSGWHDREDLSSAFHHYEETMARSPERERQWLLIGPWSHVSSRSPSDEYAGVASPGAGVDMDAIHVRFFDRFLRGEDNGVDEEPRVRLYDPGEGRWEVRPAWGEGTREHRLYLGGDGAMADAAGAEGSDSYRYDPLDAPGIRFDPDAFLWEPPLDLSELEAQDGVVAWTSEPLAEELTVHGWGELELFATTDGEDTDWHVKLADVEPGGRPLAVAWGCLRASYRDSLSEPRPVTPGKLTSYSIELTPAFHTFRAGHRVRVLLASADYPWFARNLNRFGPIADQDEPRTATNTIHHGAAHPSCLRLPVEGAGS